MEICLLIFTSPVLPASPLISTHPSFTALPSLCGGLLPALFSLSASF